jgi:hypothetical protein
VTDDPKAAAKRRVVELTLKAWSFRWPAKLSEAEEEERTALLLLLAPRSVPTGIQARADLNREQELYRWTITPNSAPLTESQQDELVEILARLVVYNRSPEGVARARLYTLMFQSFEPEGLSPAEREEQVELQRRWPPLPVDPNHPMREQIAILEDLCRRLESGERGASVRNDTAWRDEV